VSREARRFHGGDPPVYLTSPFVEQTGLPHLFTTRHFPGITSPSDPEPLFGPDAMAILGRRGLGREPVAFLRQVHGADVVVASGPGRAGTADVLMTDRPGLPLAIFTADCLPIIIYDPTHRRLAVVHAGWRGTVQSVAREAARALIQAGSRAEDLIAVIGPSIGPCCYEVDRPVIDRLEAAFPGGWDAWVTARPGERWRLDLWAANEDQLRAAGLRPGHIANLRLCTACRLDLFFSYRRGSRGRLAAVAAVPAAAGA
jgi:hypothetical protein